MSLSRSRLARAVSTRLRGSASDVAVDLLPLFLASSLLVEMVDAEVGAAGYISARVLSAFRRSCASCGPCRRTERTRDAIDRVVVDVDDDEPEASVAESGDDGPGCDRPSLCLTADISAVFEGGTQQGIEVALTRG